MRHSTAPRRLIAVATLTALLGGVIGASAPALARNPVANGWGDLTPRIAGPGISSFGASRPRGMVDPRNLPHTQGSALRPTKPVLSRPTASASGPKSVKPAGVPVAPDPLEVTLTTNPPVGQPGVDGFFFGSGPNTLNEPPDPWVAAGPDHVIQTVNLSMQILDRSGNLIQAVDLADFFLLPPNYGHSDPRVIFDSLHQRWLMTEVSWVCDPDGGGAGFVDYLVSSTADPTDPWRLDFFGFLNELPDYPAPGTSTANVAFASNRFAMDTAMGNDCVGGPGVLFAGVNVTFAD